MSTNSTEIFVANDTEFRLVWQPIAMTWLIYQGSNLMGEAYSLGGAQRKAEAYAESSELLS